MQVEIRGKLLNARVVKPPFVRNGKVTDRSNGDACMSNVPADLKYTKTHEWVEAARRHRAVGITDHAQDELGDLVFVEVPEPAARSTAGEACAVVESVKAAADIYAPVAGEVVAANAELDDAREHQPGPLRRRAGCCASSPRAPRRSTSLHVGARLRRRC